MNSGSRVFFLTEVLNFCLLLISFEKGKRDLFRKKSLIYMNINFSKRKKQQQKIPNANISTKGSDDFPLSIGKSCLHLFIFTYKQFAVFEYLSEKFILPRNFVSVSSPSCCAQTMQTNFKQTRNKINSIKNNQSIF